MTFYLFIYIFIYGMLEIIEITLRRLSKENTNSREKFIFVRFTIVISSYVEYLFFAGTREKFFRTERNPSNSTINYCRSITEFTTNLLNHIFTYIFTIFLTINQFQFILL